MLWPLYKLILASFWFLFSSLPFSSLPFVNYKFGAKIGAEAEEEAEEKERAEQKFRG